jgi:hypothetical protein
MAPTDGRTELPLPRKMWRTLEVYHGMIYFVPEAAEHYAKAGVREGRSGYFVSRSAPMGAVSGEVVIATFFNFHPELVRHAMDGAWEGYTPAAIVEARLSAADAALRRLLGEDALSSGDMEEAATLARIATEACTPEGRPLYAGHASLAWPDAPHLVLWHAITLLREYRGDGHLAAMTTEGISGCEALVMHAATGDVAAETLRSTRSWPREEWDATCERLRARGWLDDEAHLTRTGWEHRSWVETRTDEMARPPWEHLGEERSARLRTIVRPWSRAITEGGAFGFAPT